MPTDFCELANSYVAELRARGREIDAARKLPQDIADRLAEDGFYRLCTPQEIGGVGASPEELALVCEALAAGNGSVCLLYTSPSPRDKRQSRMPSSA